MYKNLKNIKSLELYFSLFEILSKSCFKQICGELFPKRTKFRNISLWAGSLFHASVIES